MTKKILTTKGIKEMDVDGALLHYQGMIKEFAIKSLMVLENIENHSLDIDDLVQIGNMQMLEAFDGYNPELNVCFSTYLNKNLSMRMNRLLRDLKRKKRAVQGTLLYIDNDEDVNYKESIPDSNSGLTSVEEETLDRYIETRLNKEQLMIVTRSLKKSANKEFGDSKIKDIIERYEKLLGVEVASTKKELSEQMGISRPTLEKRIIQTKLYIKELFEQY